MTPFPLATDPVTSPREIAAQAYLITWSEDLRDRPVFGDAITKEVMIAFQHPHELRLMLPERLRKRFDWWYDRLGAVQLELFTETL